MLANKVRAAREARCADSERNRDALAPRARACLCVILGGGVLRVAFAATDASNRHDDDDDREQDSGQSWLELACGTKFARRARGTFTSCHH